MKLMPHPQTYHDVIGQGPAANVLVGDLALKGSHFTAEGSRASLQVAVGLEADEMAAADAVIEARAGLEGGDADGAADARPRLGLHRRHPAP